MIQRLHSPELPQNERNRIVQRAVDFTKRKAYKECLVQGECKGPIVGGHLIPRAWLKSICDENENVRAFAELPINVFGADCGENHFPVPDHINNVFVGSFTCRRHEEMFSPIDDPDPDLTDYRNLNLMLYKPILATLWRQKLLLQMAQDSLAEVPQREPFQFEVRLQQQRIKGLEYYKRQVERCLSPQTCRRCRGGKCKVIGHKIFHIPGEPALALSDFSDGVMERRNPRFNSVERIMNWGMTVLPLSRGHKVIFHHFIEEESIAEPVGQMLSRLQGKKLQGQISYRILKSFEHLAISAARWEQFGKRRRSAILDVFLNEIPDIGFGTMEEILKWEKDRFKPDLGAPNPNQLNLFNPDKR